MRVLLVNAFPAASVRGRAQFDEFRLHVHRVLHDMERQDVTPIEVIERSRHDLDDLVFEMHTEFADPRGITNFDRLDFVLVAGDASACVWAPPLRKLVLLTKMCMMTGKCFYGSGIGASLVAFLCSTAGEHVRALNNGGKGDIVDDISAIPPPLVSAETVVGHSAASGTDVLLDTRTGDFFTFDRDTSAWRPRGNTGVMLHTSDHDRDYGTRLNTARAGTKTHRSDLGHALVTAKRGDTKCCCRLDASSHAVVRGISREFLANCASVWDVDERINATGANKYRVLVDSRRGPVVIEFGNCIGTHVTLAREYKDTTTLLRNFLVAKYESLQVHEHIDRSYVSAIAGSTRLKERLQLAATKTPIAVLRPDNASGVTTMTSGRTSPKRCRPVSAGPTRSPPKHRTIQTSRSEYPSSSSFARVDSNNQSEAASRPARPHTARAARKGHEPETTSPLVPEEETLGQQREIKAHRRIRVAQQNERDKPYCAIDKFTAMEEKDRYYSVVNDAPYESTRDRDVREQQERKLKWVGGPFCAAVGKASTQLPPPEVSVFARVPFDQRNAPDFIIQRRQLDPPSPPEKPSKQKKTCPASASASLRRSQR